MNTAYSYAIQIAEILRVFAIDRNTIIIDICEDH